MSIHQLFPLEELAAPAKNIGTAFDDFWAIWPRRCAKKVALRAWAKLRPAERQAAMDALPAHVAQWTAKFGACREYIPHPASWINGARWEDELDPATVKNAAGQVEEVTWWTTWTGIVEKGAALGLVQAPAELHVSFKARVYAKAGPGKWSDQVRGAVVTAPVVRAFQPRKAG